MSLLENSAFLQRIMFDFQEENNIERECVSNTHFFLTELRKLIDDGVEFIAKPKVVMAFYMKKFGEIRTPVINVAHVVADVDGVIIDPSYEIYSKDKLKYFDTIKEVSEYLDKANCGIEVDRYAITEFLTFKNLYEENMTFEKGKVYDVEYYDKQELYLYNYIMQ
tara:strand:+ start:4769 stop:5263 length:495 start_codon:yes stop_codon:yes gene_type:complete